MKKIILYLLFFMMATPSFADMLLSPKEQAEHDAWLAQKKREYKANQSKCPKSKPLYFDGACHSCDEEARFQINPDYEKCEELCPQRKFFRDIRGMGKFDPKFCILPIEHIRNKRQKERDEKATRCKCPKSHPLYGRSKDQNGHVIERCYSCNTPEKLPEITGDTVCSQSRTWGYDEENMPITELQMNKRPDTTTRPCQSAGLY